MKMLKGAVALAVAAIAVTAIADTMDRPAGIRIGQRMILKPYVALGVSYDSNANSSKHGEEDIYWSINPGLTIDCRADNWSLGGGIFYQYNAYTRHTNQSNYDYHGYGENLLFTWTDSAPGERGWSLRLAEQFIRINPTDDMSSEGATYGSDRSEFRFTGGLERRFAHQIHAEARAGYYWLEYDNFDNKYNSGLWGWTRWDAGGSIGWALSQWTDFMITADYHGYTQDNNSTASTASRRISGESDGWTIQAGLGSYATERITYRALVGWSYFEYGGNSDYVSDGFTYSLSGSWKISDTLSTMFVAASYYQPSEREYASSHRTDSLSWGIAKSMVRGKLTTKFDVAYRRETRESSEYGQYDYDIDAITFRLGVNYTLNRFLAAFCNVEYRDQFVDGDSERGKNYEYDRIRGTIGLRFTY